MKRFVFATKKFEDETNRHGAMNVFKRFKDKVENHNFEHQPRSEYSTIKDGRRYVRYGHQNFRAVYEYREIKLAGKEVGVYVGLRDFNHDDDYKRFYKTSTDKVVRDSITSVNDVDWESIEKKVTDALSDDTVHELKSLTDEERILIDDSKSINHEIMPEWVYESESWKKQMMTEEYQSVHIDIVNKLNDFFFKAIVEELEDGIHLVSLRRDRDYIVLRKEGTDFFLLELGDEKTKDKWADKTTSWLRTNSRRGYPCSILDDPDEWYKMELDENSNFILSDEERDIVMSQSEYPLFISGRAGSGKSTVLQYMFAELLLRYIKVKRLPGGYVLPPVYLSYSKNLVINAQRLAESLFRHNNVYQKVLKKEGLTFDEDVAPLLKTCFRVFGDIVMECIEDNNKDITKQRFYAGRHITYADFNKAWAKHFGRNQQMSKNIGPSISWHVINTYIKGWDSSDILTPSDYKELGRDDKSVSQSVYEEVYNKVWAWYKDYCEEDQLWDDQDLVRYSVSPDDNSAETYVTERFSGVFCDEAQDFTRTQIDFILQLSSFFNRSLHGNRDDIFKLPFVFAGDEFQTLNPTGFRWDVLRSYFMDTLRRSCNIEEVSAPKPKQLSENYRSSGSIVKLGNRFQLLRESRFGMPSNPQVEHFQSNAAPVLCLPADNDNVWQQLKIKSAILIVPSPEGMKKEEYINSTPIKGKISFDKNGISKGITILSPAQAKGLEYPCVAIYGFDQAPLHDKVSLRGLIHWYESDNANAGYGADEENMALKYLVSNAYVAVTRARKNLYILDNFTPDSFWSFAFSFHNDDLKKEEEKLQGLMLSSLSGSRKNCWESKDLGYIGEGTTERDINAGDMSVTDIKKSLAEMESTALNSGDYDLMLQVASRYRERGLSADAARCSAEAYIMQERFAEAGKEFMNAGLSDKAVECYWQVISENGSIKAIAQCKSTLHVELVNACKAIIKGKVELKDVSKLINHIVTKQDMAIKDVRDNNRWLLIIRRLLDDVSDNERSSKEIAKRFLQQYDSLCTIDAIYNDAEDLRSKAARIAFNAGLVEEAMTYWEKSQNKPADYYHEKLKKAKYPDTISLRRAINVNGWQKQVLSEFRENKKVYLSGNNMDIVLDAIMNDGTSDDFMAVYAELLIRTKSVAQAEEIMEKANKKHVPYNAIVLHGIIEAEFTDLREWKGSLRRINDNGIRQALTMIRDLKKIRSPRFDYDLPTGTDRAIREFMSKNFGDYPSNSIWLMPIIAEIGRKYESRHRFVDTLSFYEWALNQGLNGRNRDQIRLRWIYNKEQKGDMEEARQRRLQWGFPEQGELPLTDNFTPWNEIIKEAIQLPETDNKSGKEKIDEKETPNTSNRNSKNRSSRTVEVQVELSDAGVKPNNESDKEVEKISTAKDDYKAKYDALKVDYDKILSELNQFKEKYQVQLEKNNKLMEKLLGMND